MPWTCDHSQGNLCQTRRETKGCGFWLFDINAPEMVMCPAHVHFWLPVTVNDPNRHEEQLETQWVV